MGIGEFLGGIALILFGSGFLRRGLDRLFGGRLAHWLARVSTRPLRAFSAGIVAGAATPSSTSLSLLAVHFIKDERIRATGVLAMLLGANVGMSVSVQAMAFRAQDHAPVLVACGVVPLLYARREWLRGLGQCILALGFIFLAIKWIGDGGSLLAGTGEVRAFFLFSRGHPWLVLAGTATLAVALQSSGAAVGLGLGLCGSGLVDAALLMPWVTGTILGVGVSTLLAGWRTVEGRRLGAGSLLVKAGLALPLMLFPAAAHAAFHALPGDLARQTATAYTLFNLVAGLAALPLLPLVWRLASALVPGPRRKAEAMAQAAEVRT